MPALIESTHLNRLEPGRGITVTIGDNTFALFRLGSLFYAMEAWCLRCGTRLADDGHLEGRIVPCGGCDWRYDVTTGCVVGLSALRLNTFEVRVVSGQTIVVGA